jgi:hypothetical protein
MRCRTGLTVKEPISMVVMCRLPVHQQLVEAHYHFAETQYAA